jgi:hypothetical protein
MSIPSDRFFRCRRSIPVWTRTRTCSCGRILFTISFLYYSSISYKVSFCPEHPLQPRALLSTSGRVLPCGGWVVNVRLCTSPILLLTYPLDIFAAIGGIINATWIREHAVIYGSLCTAQGSCVQEYPCRTPFLILSPSRCHQTFGGCWYCHLVSATFLLCGSTFVTYYTRSLVCL